MSEEIKELLFLLHNDKLTETGKRKLEQEIERLNNIINELEKVADARMNTILKIEQYLIDSGVDDDILKCCNIYDVNGVELRKYIEELKGDSSNE